MRISACRPDTDHVCQLYSCAGNVVKFRGTGEPAHSDGTTAMTIGAARATYDDVNLVIRLYELRRDERLREARRWFGASFKAKTLDEFHALCPMGSEPTESYRMVVTYWDMVASFLTSGVVNQELFFQSGGELLF